LINQVKLEHIILGCKKTSRESQRELYKLYYGFAMGICVRYCNNEVEGEEVVNDGFLKIFNQIKNFVPINNNYEASFTGWIKRIFINTAIDNYRKNNKHYEIATIDDNHITIAANDEMPIDTMSYKEIISLVQNLSPIYRTVFNLFVIDGLRHEDIADKLGIAVGTSKSNLAKAKQNIQKMLKQTNVELYEQRRAI
jgi:RNA polymerase sigma factor (sigma-70 family)